MRYLAFLILLFFACGKSNISAPADLIVFGAEFFTADSTEIEAFAVRGDRIIAVGKRADVMRLKGDSTLILDLSGKFVMPGLIEGHGHFQALGRSLIEPNLLAAKSYDEVVQAINASKEFAPPGGWITGRGWHQEKWTQAPAGAIEGYPTHHALSQVTPDHPVILDHASGHAILANAKAMELAGVNAKTKDVPGGRILRDKQGDPTGVFEENAMELIKQRHKQWVSALSESERYTKFAEGAKKASQEALKHGITSFQDAGSTLEEIQMYRRTVQENLLQTRLWVMFLQPKAHELPLVAQARQIDTTQHMLTTNAVKAYFDGALGSYGAWLLQPYADKPGFVGQNTTPTDTIKALAAFCAKHGMQFCVHAIGDRANREILNIMEAAQLPNARWRIEHAQHVDPQDMPRFAQLGVIASMQPIHCTADQPFVVKRLGEARARAGAYPWRALLNAGARFCGGTDVPVELIDPFANIYAAVTRRRVDTGAELFKEQALTRREALLAYTAWNAYAANEEQHKGALKPGLLADFVVLDRNLLTCPDEAILKTNVLEVWLGGKKVK